MAEEDEKATSETIGLVNRTVEELKDYVRETDIPDEQQQKILRAERYSKKRKTDFNFLEEQVGEEIDSESGDMDLELFDRMHKDQYKGNVNENMDGVIETSKEVFKG